MALNLLNKSLLILLLFLKSIAGIAQDDYYPSPILQLNSYLSHHILLAEKSTHKLYLFENNNSFPKLVKTYQMATGKKSGDKVFQGDHRTPEGIYTFLEFIPRDELIRRHGKEGEIYGIGAFVMNYPNPMDSREQKTGSGIWLHSTNDETRIDKGLDSRGCVVVANNDLKDISQFLEVNKTQIIIVENLNYQNAITWNSGRQKLIDFINSWKNSWQDENIDDYKLHYHPNDFFDSTQGNYQSFINYKKNVFSNPGKPSVILKEIDILQTQRYTTVSFIQDYTSNTIRDYGKKTLYLKLDEFYNWKIVSEKWTKAGVGDYNNPKGPVAFKPTNRFFTTSKDSNLSNN